MPLILLAVAVPIALYLFTRPTGEPLPPAEAAAAEPARTPASYRNRGYWTAPQAPSARQATRITGTTYDIDGNPLPGVLLSALTFEVAGNRASPVRSVESDATGRFELLLADGSYYVAARKDGFGPIQVVAHSGDEVGIVLQKSGVIQGRVTTERGDEVSRFSIDLVGPMADDMPAPAALASRTFDSVDGSFRIEEVPEGAFHVRASAVGFAPSFSPLVLAVPGESHTVDLVLSAGCTLRGVVKDSTGAPLADVLVDAERRQAGGAGMLGDASIDTTSQAETGSDGQFELPNVPVGDVMIRAYDGMHAVSNIALKVGRCDEVSALELRMGAGGGLTGVVRDAAGEPVAGAKVVLSHRAMGFVNTLSDAEGRYHFDRLPAAEMMRLQALRGDRNVTALIGIEEGTTAEKDLQFSPAGKGEIRGRVTAGAAPLSGIQLTLVTNEDTLLGISHPMTGVDGTFRAGGLQEGMYMLIVSSIDRVMTLQLKDGAVETVDIDVAHRPEPPPRPAKPPALDSAPGEQVDGEVGGESDEAP